jgi:3-phosphoshikimate 1-carboxyvinyltransferase
MHAMATELRKVGATVETGRDYIIIDPPEKIEAVEIDTYGDHRVAMSFSLAALGNSPVQINDPDCTRKTFPDFFAALDSVSIH